jgi:pimeloyl-ACP methyl ester carboxylesterase
MSEKTPARPWFRVALGLGLGLMLIWILWTESHPEHEAWLRNEAQSRLHAWFPDAMQPAAFEIGFDPAPQAARDQLLVILIHGLDEPGGIFDELAEALTRNGYAWTRFRYPNDQAISESTDLLTEHWSELPENGTVVLLGHSMGGLLIRDFITRALPDPYSTGTAVAGALLIGTPNQGSEWARLRVWLELRDRFGANESGDFALFAGLRDGTGAAKIDLRPNSRFLSDLNARPWPGEIPLNVLGGQIRLSSEDRRAGLDALAARTGDPDWTEGFARWLDDSAPDLGDGVVGVDALPAPGAPEPDVVNATHRGLLVSGPLNGGDPPGIAWTLDQLQSLNQ